jgi:rhodanese-related sulfurtransferase
VREPEEFSGALGHIAGAELVPLVVLASCASCWPREESIAVVCRSGARSARAATLLVALGFQDVSNVVGGMQAHFDAGLPVTR